MKDQFILTHYNLNNIKLEILEGSYWMHYKEAKDIALYLPLNHPKRIKLEKEMI